MTKPICCNASAWYCQTRPFGLTPFDLQKHRGFTLIELLIALSLIGMLVVMIYGGLHLGSRAWDSIERHSESTDELQLARSFLQRTLRQAYKAYGKFEDKSLLLFIGNQEQLELAAPLSGFLNMSGLYLLRFAQISHGQRRDLIIQRWLIHPDIFAGKIASVPKWRPLEKPLSVQIPYDAPWGIYGTSLLLPNSEPLAFSYFGRLPDSADFGWQDEWKDRSELPSLVKISLGNASGWPDLIVAMAGEGVATNSSLTNGNTSNTSNTSETSAKH